MACEQICERRRDRILLNWEENMGLEITNLHVELQKTEILKGVSLEIKTGEFVSLLGASGCGKSTLLKSIAGLLEVKEGEISIDGKEITTVAPEKRGTVIVFQDLRLFPHMTVEQNITFAMELKKIPKEEQKKKIEELLEAVQLPGFEKRKIREMSGGQKQRVALARALAAEPKILLLDEPFSSLDENLREEMARLVKKLHKQLGLTAVMVTHDKAEAMKLSDRIALMKDGEVLQYDNPAEMFYYPVSKSVADYMGQTNYIQGVIREGLFVSEAVSFATDNTDGNYELMIRPSAIHLSREGKGKYCVKEVLFEGETAEVTVVSEREELTVWMLHDEWNQSGLKENDYTGIIVDLKNAVLFEETN